jgi:methionine-rich copper-binding protein CopC
MTMHGPRSRSGPLRTLGRLAVVLLLATAAAVGLAGPAAAHNVLISSDPTDGSTLSAAPTTVTLTFDQPVQDFEPIVTVTGPDGQPHASGAPTIDSNVVTNDVGPLTQSGPYLIAYRVVSADGHPVQGEIHFELAGAAVTIPGGGATVPVTAPSGSAGATASPAGAPASAASSSAASSSAASSAAATTTGSSSGLSGWVWAALGLAAALIGAALVVIVRRPRPQG